MDAKGRMVQGQRSNSERVGRVKRRHGAVSVALILVLVVSVCALPALAAEPVWLGGMSNDSWQAGSNWNSGASPSDGDTAVFRGSPVATTPTLNGSVAVGSIIFEPDATTFSIQPNGHQLTLTGAGIINDSGLKQTIANTADNSKVYFLGQNGFRPSLRRMPRSSTAAFRRRRILATQRPGVLRS